ncbi:hypothetical protein LA080_014491 [Diaporthe eres]|nr:hypothetical protein LA080_014491 [Diaporthe eres]
MDPLSIISLTGNIAQFISPGYGIVSTSREIYHSGTGTSEKIQTCTLLVEDMRRSIKTISKHPVLAEPPSEDTKILHAIVDECDRLGSKLLADLDTLRVNRKAVSRHIEALRVSGTMWWKKKDIDDVLSRLAMLEARLRAWWDVALPLPKEEDLSSQQREISAGLSIDQIIEKRRGSDATRAAARRPSLVQSDLYQLRDTAEKLNTPERLLGVERRVQSSHSALRQDGKLAEPQSLDAEAQKEVMEEAAASLEAYARQAERLRRQHRILKSLVFQSLWTRHERIEDAYVETLHWVWDSPITKFGNWLEKGEGVYWIEGLAGSGKSTMMKYISSHPSTTIYLRRWASAMKFKMGWDPKEEPELLVASHYFWYAGTEMQKSHRGLLQTLLFHVLRTSLEVQNAICPERLSSQPWSLRELKDTIHELKRADLRCCVCFFIDGLDEYLGDEEEIIEVVKDLAACPWIKVCASSRPWPAFFAEWNSSPLTFKMQEYTRRDMTRFVHESFTSNKGFKKALDRDQRCRRLVRAIVERAEGVWLWVYLVVRDLLRDMRDNEPFEHLQKRLDSYPRELGEYFRNIFDRFDPLHAVSSAKLMLAATSALRPMSMMALVALEEDEGFAAREDVRHLDSFQLQDLYLAWRPRLQNRCRDLMKLTRGRPRLHEYQVDFLHRTVRDYLMHEHRAELRVKATPGFDERLFLCRVKLLELKTSGVNLRLGRLMQDVKELLFYASSMEHDEVMPADAAKMADATAVVEALTTLWIRFRPMLENQHANDSWGEGDKTRAWDPVKSMWTYNDDNIKDAGLSTAEADEVTAEEEDLLDSYMKTTSWRSSVLSGGSNWPDIPYVAAAAGITEYSLSKADALRTKGQVVSDLLLCALETAGLGVEQKPVTSPAFVRNARLIAGLLARGADPNHTAQSRATAPWVVLMGQVSAQWGTYASAWRDVAVELIKAMVRSGADLGSWPPQGNSDPMPPQRTLVEFVRHDLGEGRTADELEVIIAESAQRGGGRQQIAPMGATAWGLKSWVVSIFGTSKA